MYYVNAVEMIVTAFCTFCFVIGIAIGSFTIMGVTFMAFITCFSFTRLGELNNDCA